MGNWISGTLDPEADVATPPPSVLSLHERYSLDPRSPSTFFKRTPILVCDKPNPIIDPRSPSFEIIRTPLFCSYHKENEVMTTQAPQPAAPFTSSPMVTKIKPLCFEGDSEREEEEECENESYLSIMSEQNVSTHHNITLAQPGYLSDQMTHQVAECSITDKPDICCDSIAKLDDQDVCVAKLTEPDEFSNNVSESAICSDPVQLPLEKQVSTEIIEDEQKEAKNGNTEKNHCSDGDAVTDVTGDELNVAVGGDGSYISSNTTPITTNDASVTTTTTTTTASAAVTCTDAGHEQQMFSVGAPDRKERVKASSIPLAVKKTTRTETEFAQSSAFDNFNKRKTAMSLQQHYNNNIYKSKKTTKAMVTGGGGVVPGVRSPLQSRNCASVITGNNRHRSSLAKMPARANINATGGGAGVKMVSKPVFNWGLESSEVKSVHDKENMSIR